MGKIKVTQVKSAIRRPERQKRTLVALGITKLHQTIEVEATPQIRGMVQKVLHLVVSPEVALILTLSSSDKVDKTEDFPSFGWPSMANSGIIMVSLFPYFFVERFETNDSVQETADLDFPHLNIFTQGRRKGCV